MVETASPLPPFHHWKDQRQRVAAQRCEKTVTCIVSSTCRSVMVLVLCSTVHSGCWRFSPLSEKQQTTGLFLWLCSMRALYCIHNPVRWEVKFSSSGRVRRVKNEVLLQLFKLNKHFVTQRVSNVSLCECTVIVIGSRSRAALILCLTVHTQMHTHTHTHTHTHKFFKRAVPPCTRQREEREGNTGISRISIWKL